MDRCREHSPPLEAVGQGHLSACWVAHDLGMGRAEVEAREGAA
jgi:hypothetical protein